jgi:hypothetical protein
MIWSATYFYPWTGLLRFFPKDIEEKARLHAVLNTEDGMIHNKRRTEEI